MKVNRSKERDIFLKYIADIYSENYDEVINYDTIYDELRKFLYSSGKRYEIKKDSLLGIQFELDKKFKKDSRFNTFVSNNYFWVIENRNGISHSNFYQVMKNSVKLYIPFSLDNLFNVSSSLFDFMAKENIVMQCKISKFMRNDALVCRVRTKEDALKVSEFVNKFNHKTDIKPNPFIYDNNGVSVAKDGCLSYNSSLCKIISFYMQYKKDNKSLNNVSSRDFANFVNSQINLMKEHKSEFMYLYGLESDEEYKYFEMIVSFIFKNCSDKLSLEEIFNYGNPQDKKYTSSNNTFIDKRNVIYDRNNNSSSLNEVEKNNLLLVITYLNAHYGYDKNEVHGRFMNYIRTGNINYFTRGNKNINPREIIYEYFPPERFKYALSCIGWDALVEASRATYSRYGYEWLKNAINGLIINNNLNGFTNKDLNDDVVGYRSKLGLVIPLELLKEVAENKLRENGVTFNSVNLTDFIMKEIFRLQDMENMKKREQERDNQPFEFIDMDQKKYQEGNKRGGR